FLGWLPLTLLLFLGSPLIARMLEDRLFGMPLHYITLTVLTVAVLSLFLVIARLLWFAVSATKALFSTSAPSNARRAILLFMQTYALLTFLMASIYSGLEQYTHGVAFADMLPGELYEPYIEVSQQ